MRYKKQKHITRMDHTNATGWWVRFLVGSSKKSVQKHASQKLFSDFSYTSKKKAYLAAIAWRDQQLENGIEGYNYGKKTTKAQYFESHPRNVTGVVGVSLSLRADRRPNYTATWRETSAAGTRVVRCKCFSFEEGDTDAMDKAFKQAARYRKKMLKVHYVGPRVLIS